MPLSTVPTHQSICSVGLLGGKLVISFSGRLHYYEGYTMQEVTFPVRVMQALGVKYCIMSNAAGGLNSDFVEGQLVAVSDHINTFPDNPLRGKHDPRLGVMFPDLSQAYDTSVRQAFDAAFTANGVSYAEGIYLGLQGPSLETPAEYANFKNMGADMLGMSTVPEVIVANQAGIKTGVISVITNVFNPNDLKPTLLEDVVTMVESIEPKLIQIIKDTLSTL